MISHKEKIFIIGGNSGINKRQDVIETEMYAPDFDQWTTVAPLPMGQSEAGACIFQNKIYRSWNWAIVKIGLFAYLCLIFTSVFMSLVDIVGQPEDVLK